MADKNLQGRIQNMDRGSWTTSNFQKEIASVYRMKIHQRSGYEKDRLLHTFIAYVPEGLSCNSGLLWDCAPIN